MNIDTLDENSEPRDIAEVLCKIWGCKLMHLDSKKPEGFYCKNDKDVSCYMKFSDMLLMSTWKRQLGNNQELFAFYVDEIGGSYKVTCTFKLEKQQVLRWSSSKSKEKAKVFALLKCLYAMSESEIKLPYEYRATKPDDFDSYLVSRVKTKATTPSNKKMKVFNKLSKRYKFLLATLCFLYSVVWLLAIIRLYFV